ncbi:MAG TPA: biopolymer transporter ExbD [Sphingomicrobium sp.]|jgi:biopolymer transport protein ExbD|nr:biopolymer transporter ExbD [Sphingomicrobium sp.]
MAHVLPAADSMPMSEINTTPLIDVMLVLLIMLIITIPLQTHAVKLDIPSCDKCPIPDATKNEVVITRGGAILWNGADVGEAGLRYELALTRRMRTAPELHLRPDPEARYEVVDKVLADIKRADVKKVGFVGNEAYALPR